MTLILMHDRFMACDSISVSGTTRMLNPPGDRKIVRCPDGSLFASGGSRLDGEKLRAWAEAGLDFANPPIFHLGSDYEGEYRWALMRPDGRKYLGNLHMDMHETGTDALGAEGACDFAAGAIDALLHPNNPPRSPRSILMMAMHLVIERNIYVAAPVYVFDLDHPEKDP